MNKRRGLALRMGLTAALLLAATPVPAQDNSTATPPPPSAAENIGPRELSNFSLGGTVTRRAEPQNTTQPASPPAREPEARTATQTTRAQDRPAPVRQAANEPQDRPARATSNADPVAAPPSSRNAANSAAAAAATAAPAFANPVTAPPGTVEPIESEAGFSPLPWLAALLLLGAGAAVYFGRQRQTSRYAIAGASAFQGERPAAEPPPPAPRPQPAPVAGPPVRRAEPQPAPVQPKPAGVVASSLRPWIELELLPSQATLTDEHAAIAFDVTLFNSGSAPARDVAVEACLINAGHNQDVQLTQFYATPGEGRDKIPAVAPMARITLKSAVRLPREAVQEYEVEGRKLFVPMVAVNSRYRWSSGEGQSAASFLVGRAANDSERLAPLRLDQGARGWKGLAARRYEKGIRR